MNCFDMSSWTATLGKGVRIFTFTLARLFSRPRESLRDFITIIFITFNYYNLHVGPADDLPSVPTSLQQPTLASQQNCCDMGRYVPQADRWRFMGFEPCYPKNQRKRSREKRGVGLIVEDKQALKLSCSCLFNTRVFGSQSSCQRKLSVEYLYTSREKANNIKGKIVHLNRRDLQLCYKRLIHLTTFCTLSQYVGNFNTQKLTAKLCMSKP